jgi:DNA-binding transcriptional ArsR family regulator
MLFTSEDIARTRIAPRSDPLWELILAIHMLRRQPGDLLFTHWRRQAQHTLRAANLGDHLSLLLTLIPHLGYFPDFLNPIDALHGLEEGLEAIRSTPRPTLHNEIDHLAQSRHLPPSARPIAAGDPTALIELTNTMQTCYDLTIRPHHRSIHTTLDRDRQLRMKALADQGVHGLFDSLHPMVRWSANELQIPGHRHQELRLDGRGLLLIPAYFCISAPITLFDPSLPPVLIYPAQHHPDTLPARDHAPRAALAALLGATLNTISVRRTTTTTDLARHLTISTASVSEHTTVLRNAGLITSHRDRNRMLHQPTPLGHALLENNPSPTTARRI